MAEPVVEEYEAPMLTQLGTLSELTMGGSGYVHGDVLLGVGSLINIETKIGL